MRVKSACGMLLFVAWLVTAVAPAGASGLVIEKDANLDISLRVAAVLRPAGVTVTMTRTTDRTVDLGDRTGLANRLKVDAFVAIHNNASSNRSASGTDIYRSLRGGGSADLGAAMQRSFGASFASARHHELRTWRGCCGDYLFQLRETTMPAVLVECAFVTNPDEGRALRDSEAFRQKLADSIANGVLAYQRTLVTHAAPRPDPGVRAPSPLPPPTSGSARALGAHRVALSWDAPAGLGTTYRIYRDGTLLAALGAARAHTLTDRWAAPGQSYTYDVVSAREIAPGVWAESVPFTLHATTPAISVVIDPGHGGADPGAVARA